MTGEINEIVKIENGRITASFNTIKEAKQAIKELKIKKKEYSLQKKEINNQMKSIRAEYTSEVRSRGSMVRGGGTILSFARSIQRVSRDNRKSQLANDLKPYEIKASEIDNMLVAIDKAIIQVEGYIVQEELKQQTSQD